MSSQKKVRVRFAPSPTGGLHLGGVRTALFNYLFAKQHDGEFILRIEDTDQTRFVPGAEEYINECLSWCGILPDESPSQPGAFGPYRQSERKPSYRQYAEQLVAAGYAYYAFDTSEELDALRQVEPNFRYSHENRLGLRNSLNLSAEETQELLNANAPHTIRIKMPEDHTVSFDDMIRGRVSFETKLVDDKVLLKADGMPTYHLAVVVDDKAMEISHIFRGEEWLPSAPVHLLLWEYLGWADQMPQWAHLPLILKPDGNGKLSKRDGDRLGFPVYAMNWTDAKTGDVTKGFRELGFLPEAFVNMLGVLGWNDGTEQEIFTLPELITKFSVDRINKSGAKFDFEKAKWFNHEWIKNSTDTDLLPLVKDSLTEHGATAVEDDAVIKVLSVVKERMTYLSDFWAQASFFFQSPAGYDVDAVKPKWNADKTKFFEDIMVDFEPLDWEASVVEPFFKERVQASGMKIGELMMPFRIMLVGGKFGPDVFVIAELLGKKEVIKRVKIALDIFNG
ncbi:glutamate--tRNA ligase [Sphingobacterium yanglingense]|uniref:Glutamate--tRNA ligase n=1 Tax=Sphingobacterium yanglingense TaxID=1437280 RepID=A0A4R6W9L1_9SPHI|nr:glutamate--tRNA ligase [Sphingobacterium yanglingense]TDQ75871.1 glutamyl-tRNA synthetase [Sphingobacterium yanglingense]